MIKPIIATINRGRQPFFPHGCLLVSTIVPRVHAFNITHPICASRSAPHSSSVMGQCGNLSNNALSRHLVGTLMYTDGIYCCKIKLRENFSSMLKRERQRIMGIERWSEDVNLPVLHPKVLHLFWTGFVSPDNPKNKAINKYEYNIIKKFTKT